MLDRLGPQSMTSRVRTWLVAGVALWVAAGLLLLTLRLTYGERPAYVHVRWARSVDAPTQERLEREFGLERVELREGRTWGYVLANLSADNIRNIVTNPAVEDTHYLHRTAFRVWRTAPRRPYRNGKPEWVAVSIEMTIRVCLLLGAGTLAFAAYTFWSGRARGVPGYSAAT